MLDYLYGNSATQWAVHSAASFFIIHFGFFLSFSFFIGFSGGEEQRDNASFLYLTKSMTGI